jgi:hypothetical protein
MQIEEFDNLLWQHITEMIEGAFEFIGNNKEEVDMIYIYGSMENQNPFFNLFFGINGTIIKIHKVNSVLNRKVDVSDNAMFHQHDIGCNSVLTIRLK